MPAEFAERGPHAATGIVDRAVTRLIGVLLATGRLPSLVWMAAVLVVVVVLFGVVLPAVWSRKPTRCAAALAVLRVLRGYDR